MSDPRPAPIVPNAVMGTLIFVVSEAMLFAGLISAFTIVRTSAMGSWPPPGQPRLPVEETAFNTAALLLSAVALYYANRVFKRDRSRAVLPLAVAMGLGAFFVIFQGVEWVALIGEGLTLTSSTHGGFFYLIVGIHGLHAVGGLAVLTMVWWRLTRGVLAPSTFAGAQIFWYFVVGLWPILYWRVYL
jgi:heme/copper-type cytochrome/quinol oxidase subunit 3